MSKDVPLWFAVVLTLIPSVVAVAAIVAADLMDRRRLKRERQTRLREERLGAYTAFMAACDRLHDDADDDHSPEAMYSPEAMAEFRKTRALVLLLAPSKNVQESAQELSNFLLVQQPQVERGRAGEGIRRRVDAAYGVVLRKFITAAQPDLGIDPSEIQDLV